MASSSSVKLLLTILLCGTLAGCGGGTRPAASAYDEDRHNAPSPVAAQPAARGATEMRLARLEGDVAALKNDFSQLAMTYNGLMTTNDRIDALLTKLEAEKAAAPAPVVEKAPVTKAASTETKALPKEATVLGVRLGEHPDKTRLVIDSSVLGTVQTDLDNGEKLLLVTLPKMGWDAKKTVSGLSSPLVAGWSVEEAKGTQTLAIQLKKPVKILGMDKLKAENGQPARVVIDLAAAS